MLEVFKMIQVYKKSGFFELGRHLFLIFSLFVQSLSWAGAKHPSAIDSSFEEYQHLLQKYSSTLGPFGNANQKEIEIILDPKEIRDIENRTHRKVGIILSDRFWTLLSDAVQFPSGSKGVYNRLLWNKSIGKPIAGVAVMILTPDGKIVLNRNFRHATRSWEYELPRGGIEGEESAESAAKREVKEETGFIVKDLKPLGEMANDSGMTNAITSVFLAKSDYQSTATPETSEAIAAVETFSLEEVRAGLIAGHMSPKNSTKSVSFRDPFLTFALWQADARGLLREGIRR